MKTMEIILEYLYIYVSNFYVIQVVSGLYPRSRLNKNKVNKAV